MKLINTTNINYLLFSIVTYIGIAAALFLVVEYLIYDEVETRLVVEKKDFENYVKTNDSWKENCYFVQDKIEMSQSTIARNEDNFKDTLLVNNYNGDMVPFRQITFYYVIDSIPYKIKIRKSLLESNRLIKYLMSTVLVFLSIALSIMFFFQRRISRKLWSPFYKTLIQAKAFEVNKSNLATFDQVSTYEFNELNEVLNKMTTKINNDYKDLKEFTENASHEIQTPLSLMNARIEELIQSDNLSEKQMNWIQEIHNSSLKISKLHQALLLLSKINNSQFADIKEIHLNEYIKHKIIEFEDIFEEKNIRIHLNEEEISVIAMNASLADILFSNLIGNAVKHNFHEGEISIRINNRQFEISNTGTSFDLDPNRLFDRFKKGKQESESLGLGLSIAKRICENYKFKISYFITGNVHKITVEH